MQAVDEKQEILLTWPHDKEIRLRMYTVPKHTLCLV